MFTYVDSEKSAKIKVIGVGGAGGNAINNMIESNLQGVLDYVSTLDTFDFYLLQEVDIKSKRSYRINQVVAIGDKFSTRHT